jgi:hypothetical protein
MGDESKCNIAPFGGGVVILFAVAVVVSPLSKGGADEVGWGL